MALRGSSRSGGRGFPGSIRRSVRAGEHDSVAVGIAQPDFPMVWTAVTVRRIAMARKDDLRPQLRDAGNRRVEVADLKPQEHSVSMSKLWVADGAVVMLKVPAMQLKHQPPIGHEPFIIRPAVVAPAAEQLLIP